MKKPSKKQIAKQLPVIGRPLVHSRISDATIYNFTENRECIRHYFSWRIHAFLDLEMDNTPLIKRLLFVTEDLNDVSISNAKIEEFRWGHYVELKFINEVKRILASIGYAEEDSDDIVVLLLTYKYFLQFTNAIMDESWDFGDIELIEWALKYSPKNFPDSALVAYPHGQKIEFSKSASVFLHGLILDYSDTGRLREYLEIRKKLHSEFMEVKKLVDSLQGKDRGRREELHRRKIVRILYLSFRNCHVRKNEKLFAIGELISLVGNYKNQFDQSKYDNLVDYYSKRLRSLVADIDKVQIDPK